MKQRIGILFFMLSAPLARAAEEGAKQTERLTQSPLSGGYLLDTAGALVMVMVLIFAVAWLARRFGRLPGMVKGPVQIIGGVSLGARERAVLIEAEGKRLLVGVAPGQVRALHVFEGGGETAFAAQLDKASRPLEEEGAA